MRNWTQNSLKLDSNWSKTALNLNQTQDKKWARAGLNPDYIKARPPHLCVPAGLPSVVVVWTFGAVLTAQVLRVRLRRRTAENNINTTLGSVF